MAYQRKTPLSPQFGGQAFDANRTPLGGLDSGFLTQDATGTPKLSPQSATTASDTVLTVPPNATSVIFSTTAFPVDISEIAGHTQYFTLPVGQYVQLDVARQSTIYLRGNGGTAVTSFAFQLVD